MGNDKVLMEADIEAIKVVICSILCSLTQVQKQCVVEHARSASRTYADLLLNEARPDLYSARLVKMVDSLLEDALR